jgi:hypothetical protein
VEDRLWSGTTQTLWFAEGQAPAPSPLPIDADHLIRQALEVCLGRFPCQARILELTFQEGNLSSELTDLPANKGQQGGALRLRIQNPFSGLPLS